MKEIAGLKINTTTDHSHVGRGSILNFIKAIESITTVINKKSMKDIAKEGTMLVSVLPSRSSLVLIGVARRGSRVLLSFSRTIAAGAIKLGIIAGIKSKNIMNCLTIKFKKDNSRLPVSLKTFVMKLAESGSLIIDSRESVITAGNNIENIRLIMRTGNQILLFISISLISFLNTLIEFFYIFFFLVLGYAIKS